MLVGSAAFIALCVAAMLTGAGANFGLIVIQRAAGRMAHDGTELKRIFSWLGLAPALSNVVGPVLAGTLIDLGGFRLAFIVLTVLPLASMAWARRVPVEARDAVAPLPPRRSSPRSRPSCAPRSQTSANSPAGRPPRASNTCWRAPI